MKKASFFLSIILLIAFLSGCGETINGMSKDTQRIGAGTKKIFIRDS